MLWILLIVGGAAGGITLPLLCGWWQGWADSWLFAVWGFLCFAGLFVLTLLIVSVYVLLTGKPEPKPGRSRLYRLALQLVQVVDHLCGIRVVRSGLPLPEGPFLLVANHRSNFDPIVLLDAFSERTVTYISKPENFRIPIVGEIVRRLGFLAIDRVDPRKAMTTIHQAVAQLTEQSVSVCVFPEGTRSRTAKLLPFHNGVLKIAQRAKVPVATVTLQGTEQIGKRAPFRRTRVAVCVEQVIRPEEFPGNGTAELAERIRTAMLAKLGE